MDKFSMHPLSFFSAHLRELAIAVAGSLFLCLTGPARADSDRPPVVLDTQTGIHDGKSGVVLQNAPLARQPMVPAQPMATLTDMTPQAQQPIVVSPYIELPGGRDRRPVYRQRPPSGQ
jgi:hypothetical protein